MNIHRHNASAPPNPATRSRLRPAALLVAAILAADCAMAQNEPGRTTVDYSSFRIIAERNIFNANRSGRASARAPSESSEPSRVEAFTLVGTLSYRKGPFAFFDGTGAEYRTILQRGGTIAGYALTEITNGKVTLDAQTNRFEVKVGMQLRREADGPWQLRERAEQFASADDRSGFRGSDPRSRDSRGSDSRRGDPPNNDSRGFTSRGPERSTSPSPTAAPSLSSEQESEILKRLMQQREKELK